MSADFQLNIPSTLGDKSRAVDHLNNSIKVQVVAPDQTPGGAKETILGYPLCIQVRITTSLSSANLITLAGLPVVTAGTKLVVKRLRVVPSDDQTTQIAVLIGFAAVTSPPTALSPNSTGIIFSHPGMQNQAYGDSMFAMGADAQNLLITNGAPTGGGFDVLAEVYEVPS